MTDTSFIATPSNADNSIYDEDSDAVFVQEYVDHGDAMLACVRADIRDPRYPMDIIARRMLERPEIRAACKALAAISEFRQHVDVTRETIVADMQRVYEQALDRDMLAQAVASKKLQADLLGFIAQKIEVTHRDVTEMTESQLTKIAGKSLIIDADFEDVENEYDDGGEVDEGEGESAPE